MGSRVATRHVQVRDGVYTVGPCRVLRRPRRVVAVEWFGIGGCDVRSGISRLLLPRLVARPLMDGTCSQHARTAVDRRCLAASARLEVAARRIRLGNDAAILILDIDIVRSLVWVALTGDNGDNIGVIMLLIHRLLLSTG